MNSENFAMADKTIKIETKGVNDNMNIIFIYILTTLRTKKWTPKYKTWCNMHLNLFCKH